MRTGVSSLAQEHGDVAADREGACPSPITALGHAGFANSASIFASFSSHRALSHCWKRTR